MKLRSIKIERNLWGENEGKYSAVIRFDDSDSKDEFTFTLSDEQTARYLDIIRDEVIRSASELGNKLAESINKTKQP